MSVTGRTLHFFSQLVYLDAVPAMERDGIITAGALADYYLNNTVGSLYLSSRFGNIQREYELWKDFLAHEALLFSDWGLVDVLDDNGPRQSGFYGCSYLGPDGEVVTAFRGSELLGNRRYKNDYITDLSLGYLDITPQQAMVDTYWQRFGRAAYPGGLWVTGHSLGGNLALYGAVEAPEMIQLQLKECIAYNAPGFNKGFIKKRKDKIKKVSDKLTLCQNDCDLVSSLLKDIKEPFIAASLSVPDEMGNPSLEDIFYPHSNFMYLTGPDGEIVPAPQQEKCAFCELVHGISELLTLLPDFILKGLCEAVLTVAYLVPSQENATRYLAEEVTKYMSHNSLFALPEHMDKTALAYTVNMLAQRDDPAYHYKDAIDSAQRSPEKAMASAAAVLLSLFASAVSGHTDK